MLFVLTHWKKVSVESGNLIKRQLYFEKQKYFRSIGEQFNKKVRNLSQVHLSYFGIDQKCSDLVTSVRAELLKIEDYSNAVEKLGEFFFIVNILLELMIGQGSSINGVW